MDSNFNNFIFDFPQKIVCERGAINRLGEFTNEYGFKKIMIVTDQGLVKTGLIRKIESILKKSNINYIKLDTIEPNPSIKTIKYGENIGRKEKIDSLLGIGGGSCIDAAKAVGILITNGGSIEEYSGLDKYKKKPLPIIAVPTTAGTGSESSPSAVITNSKTKDKMSIFSKKGFPIMALLDAEVLTTIPAHIAASTGMDALSHAIESFVSLKAFPISDSLATKAIKLIGRYLRAFVANRKNIEAAQAMLIASNLAGISFSHTYLGDVHALSHPLGGYYNIPHGVVNAILLPHVMKFNMISNLEKFKAIAIFLGEKVDNLNSIESANKAVESVRKLSEDLNIPKNLRKIGVKEDDIDNIVKVAERTRNALVNPRTTTIEDFKDIYKNALQ